MASHLRPAGLQRGMGPPRCHRADARTGRGDASATFAQRYHWYQVGTPRNQAISDWQISRVAAVLGYADLAPPLRGAITTVCLDNDLDPFVTGFAHEAIARAAADVDDIDMFTEHLEAAKEKLLEIEDPEDRDLLEADLTEMSER